MGWLLDDETKPHVIFTDSKSMIDLAKQKYTSRKSKHIQLRYLSVRDEVDRLCYVNTKLNKADVLTKPTYTKDILNPHETVEVNCAEIGL